MDRRRFLSGGVVSRLGRGRTRPEAARSGPGMPCTWEDHRRYLVESGHYRQVRRGSNVDWLAVQLLHAPERPSLRMQLIDLDVHPEEEVVVTFAAPPNGLGFVVIGPVPYEAHGGWSREEPGLSLDLWFAQPASLELWLGDRGTDLVIVALPAPSNQT